MKKRVSLNSFKKKKLAKIPKESNIPFPYFPYHFQIVFHKIKEQGCFLNFWIFIYWFCYANLAK